MVNQFPRHGCMDDLTTERSIGLQATWIVDVLGLLFGMFSMDVCTPSQLVQVSNIQTLVGGGLRTWAVP